MFETKKETYNIMLKEGEKVLLEYKGANNLAQIVFENHNVPKGITLDYINGRVKEDNANEFILYCVFEGLDQIQKTQHIKKLYTEIEQKKYSIQQYEVKRISFPIKIKCMQVSYDQWIGISDIKFLMELRAAQLINYNTNAQRTMERVVKGKKEYYKITLNEGAIKSIRNLCSNKVYIPNTITLNIPEDNNNDWYYDNKEKELVINNIDYFDISDGYHRYMAFSRESDKDPEFNLPVELRIISFPDDKVRQFIFQEDQKTQMKKLDSQSMNMNAPSNIVLERLNESFDFYYKGEISRNEGRINFSKLSMVVDYFYFKNTKDQNINQLIREVVKELKIGLNAIADTSSWIFDKKLILQDYILLVDLIKKNKGEIELEDKQIKRYYENIHSEKINKIFYDKSNITSSLVATVVGCIK